MAEIVFQSNLPFSRQALFNYHAMPGAFQRLQPPWQTLKITEAKGGIQNGAILRLKVKIGPLWLAWHARHRDFQPEQGFCDWQEKGPFKSWRHSHWFQEQGPGQSLLRDHITYELPLKMLGSQVMIPVVNCMLKRMFAYRHWRTKTDLRLLMPLQGRRLRFVFVGRLNLWLQKLTHLLTSGGHDVFQLTPRSAGKPGQYQFLNLITRQRGHPLENADAIIDTGLVNHTGTPSDLYGHYHFLIRALKTLGTPPKLYLRLAGAAPYRQPSFAREAALGYRQKEEAAAQKQTLQDQMAGLARREATLRFGMLITPDMPVLLHQLLYLESFVFAPGGSVNPGFRWLTADDAMGAVLHLVAHRECSGAWAAASPRPGQRASFQRALMRHGFWSYATRRMFQITGWSPRPLPQDDAVQLREITTAGYQFLFSDLEPAVSAVFGAPHGPEPEILTPPY